MTRKETRSHREGLSESARGAVTKSLLRTNLLSECEFASVKKSRGLTERRRNAMIEILSLTTILTTTRTNTLLKTRTNTRTNTLNHDPNHYPNHYPKPLPEALPEALPSL